MSVKREAGKWFALFSCICEAAPLPASDEPVALDLGLTTFAALSDGRTIQNPRLASTAARRLRLCQRRIARRKKGGNGRRQAVRRLQRAQAHLHHQRADFHHQAARQLVNRYGRIVVEDLNIKGLAGGMLAKSVHDAGWSSFIDKIAYKAERAGRVLVKVDPRGTSQRCVCGAPNPKTLSQRWHQCDACGLSVARDHAAALEILRLGLEPWSDNVAVFGYRVSARFDLY